MGDNITFLLVAAASTVAVVSLTLYMMGNLFSKQSDSKKRKVDPENDLASTEDKYPAGKMSVYFGSQTGTAEGFAKIVVQDAKSKGFQARLVDLEDFKADSLASCRLAVFLMATYGEGDPTDNASAFYRWLKNDDQEVEDGFLSKMNFAVFGLGNRQYEHFNKMGKVTDKLLEKLGGARAHEYGEGDDDKNLEEDFENWKAGLWPSLLEKFHPNQAVSPASTDDSADKTVSLSFSVTSLGKDAPVETGRSRSDSQIVAKTNASTRFFFTSRSAKILVNRELRNIQPNADLFVAGSTRHIELDLKSTDGALSYETADNLAVLPINSEASVQKLAAALGYDLDDVVELKPLQDPAAFNSTADLTTVDPSAYFKHPFPIPCTVREILTNYFDVHGSLRHSLVSHLQAYTTDPLQRQWLAKLLAKENRAQFNDFVAKEGKSLFELLINELSSCKIPLADFMHIAPYMQPRYYTISSSSSCFPDTVHITVSVTTAEMARAKKLVGLCSGYLHALKPGQSCRIFIRPSSFRLPKDITTPVVMIGPGTGIAPMRALLQEREYQRKKHAAASSTAAAVGANVLYFGCRKRTADFIYADELVMYEKNGVLDKLHLAFSRDDDKKVYVQDLIRQPENAFSLLSDLKKGGYVYVCGATAMGADVLEAVVSVIKQHEGYSVEQAKEFVQKMQVEGRYVQELWSA